MVNSAARNCRVKALMDVEWFCKIGDKAGTAALAFIVPRRFFGNVSSDDPNARPALLQPAPGKPVTRREFDDTLRAMIEQTIDWFEDLINPVLRCETVSRRFVIFVVNGVE